MDLYTYLPSMRKAKQLLVIISIVTVFMFTMYTSNLSRDNPQRIPLHQIAERPTPAPASASVAERTPKPMTTTSKPLHLPTTTVETLPEMKKIPLEPVVDPELTIAELDAKLQKEIPNLAVEYMRKNKLKNMYYKNKTCARLPPLLNIETSNIYWQSFVAPDRIFQLLNAYYDNRTLNPFSPSVRIIGMTTKIDPTGNFCHLWFEGATAPHITPVKEYRYIWHKLWGTGKEGSYQPYLITCQMPFNQRKVPMAVSLVANQCDNATNLLNVVHNKPAVKRDFAVCVKGLDFAHTDISVRLIEWVELLTLLGANVIYIYKLQAHPNLVKLLEHYESLGIVKVVPLTLPGFQPNHPILQHMYLKENVMKKRHNEIITYNDCFYRSINAYKYVAVLDVDEVIMPKGEIQNWKELVTVVEAEIKKTGKDYAAYYTRNVYFLDNHMHNHEWFHEIPRHMHMLQHVYRSKNFTRPKDYVKTFFDTEKSLLLHNHLPIACFVKTCSYPISTTHAQLQHYRSGCERSVKKAICEDYKNNSMTDITIWKFRDDLILKMNTTLKLMGYYEVT